jgi:hypothetical protein
MRPRDSGLRPPTVSKRVYSKRRERTLRLIYVGAHDGVEIGLPDGILRVVLRDESVEAPDELGKRLLEHVGS